MSAGVLEAALDLAMDPASGGLEGMYYGPVNHLLNEIFSPDGCCVCPQYPLYLPRRAADESVGGEPDALRSGPSPYRRYGDAVVVADPVRSRVYGQSAFVSAHADSM